MADEATTLTDQTTTTDDKGVTTDTVVEDKAAHDGVVVNAPPVEDKAADGTETGKSKDSTADKDANVGAPETYEAFTLPEGIELDKALTEKFNEVAKDFDLSQADAQKLVDMQTAQVLDMQKAQQEEWTKLNDEWKNASKTDKEFGGEKFDANLATAKKALDIFGTDELKVALESTGAGNHPEFLRFMFRVGNAISEDSMHQGSSTKGQPRSQAQVLFPDMN